MEKKKILFVCLGNICRSPLAEAIFNHKTRQRNLSNIFEVDSCGTSNYHIGEQPDTRTIENAKENGIAIQHRARQFATTDLEYFDVILAMDKSNFNAIVQESATASHREKVKLIREFDMQDPGSDVPDPYFGGMRGFQEVFDILDRSCEALLDKLQTTA